jgi:hypothetical protein
MQGVTVISQMSVKLDELVLLRILMKCVINLIRQMVLVLEGAHILLFPYESEVVNNTALQGRA